MRKCEPVTAARVGHEKVMGPSLYFSEGFLWIYFMLYVCVSSLTINTTRGLFFYWNKREKNNNNKKQNKTTFPEIFLFIIFFFRFQAIVGAEGVSLEFRHIASFLLHYGVDNNSSGPVHQHLLNLTILCVGYFATGHQDNQVRSITHHFPLA